MSRYLPTEPSSIEDVDQLLAYVKDELSAISLKLAETTEIELRLRNVAPTKPRECMIVGADGTNWNPGGGKGIYAYLGGVWTKLS